MSGRLNITYLHRTQAKGVEGVHIGEIVNAWKRLGHDVTLVSPVGGQLGDEPATNGQAPAAGLKTRAMKWISSRLPEFLFECAELAYNIAAIRGLRALGRDRVDFIFERYAIFAFAGAFVARRWNKPFVVEINYTSQSALVRDRSPLLRPLAQRVDRYVFARATGLVAVSTFLKQHLVDAYGIDPARIVVLPNAADPDVFDMAKVGPPPGVSAAGRIIGFVGGFYPWHGLDLLLAAFRHVAADVPDARLMLVGDGPMLPAIRDQAAELGLADRVTLTGKIPHQQLPGYVTLFAIGVMPDSNNYGSPMKIFEYMSLQKPVVVPDYGPLRDAVDDGVEGRIFPARDIKAMAACLTDILRDDGLKARMGTAARNRIETRHNWLANARQILAFIPERTAS